MLYANAVLLIQFHPPSPPSLSNQHRSKHLFPSNLGILICRQRTVQITIRRSRHHLLFLYTRWGLGGSVVGGEEVEFVGGEFGFERFLGTVNGELDGESC